jgi:hypothetical protein
MPKQTNLNSFVFSGRIGSPSPNVKSETFRMQQLEIRLVGELQPLVWEYAFSVGDGNLCPSTLKLLTAAGRHAVKTVLTN